MEITVEQLPDKHQTNFKFRLTELTPDAHHVRVITLQSTQDLLEFALKQAFIESNNRPYVLLQCSHALHQLQHAHFLAVPAK